MDPMENKHIVAAALHSAGGAMSLEQLMALFEMTDITKNDMRAILQQLQEECEEGPLALVEVASGYRYQVKPEYAEHLHALADKKPPKYSRSLLETLALILYRQPITRGEIEDVRGVAVSTEMIKRLLDRRWIKVIGHKDAPGKPALYGSTKTLLDYFGLKSLKDLPPLDEVIDLEEVGSKINEQLSLNVEGSLVIPEENDVAADDEESSSNESSEPSGMDAIDAALQAVNELDEFDMETVLQSEIMTGEQETSDEDPEAEELAQNNESESIDSEEVAPKSLEEPLAE